MTVREAVAVLKGEGIELGISWGNMLTPLDTTCPLMMAAYGDFKVSHIVGGRADNYYEIEVAAMPIKE